MDVREKLVELRKKAAHYAICTCSAFQNCENCPYRKHGTDCRNNIEMDYLLKNGVTVQELALPEQDYYVLRNTETGMYFRGKGVNRWGKHFNQATIYRVKGTAEHSIKEVAWHGEKAKLVRIKIVEMP